jgi:acyl-coenzyme A synthetase/AMP-(fatty) acid ligase
MSAHPAVREIAVFGVPDELCGESVCAAVTLHAGACATAEELQQFCQLRLASYKRPRRIEFLERLPRNAGDKVQKTALRALFAR